MASPLWISAALVILLCIRASQGSSRYLTGEEFVFRVQNSTGQTCLTASFQLTFDLYYENVTYNGSSTFINVTHELIEMPNNTVVSMNGSGCNNGTSDLVLSWDRNNATFTVTMEFEVVGEQWFLSMAQLEFDLDDRNFEDPYEEGPRVYQTSAVANKYFNRTFSLRDYYYCTTDTKVWFSNTSSNSCYQVLVGEKNKTVCSFLTLSRSVIFVGDLDNSTNINRKLCMGDYIKLQELIVPIVVGAILAVLLVVIFVAYAVAYLRRRTKEGRYETLNNGY